MVTHQKLYYGTDPQAQKYGGAFYWADSDQKRREYYTIKRNQPHIAESVYQCRPGMRQGNLFREDDFAFFRQPNGYLEDGVSDTFVKEFVDKAHYTVIAWDTAFEAMTTSDFSVGIVAALFPCNKYHRDEDVGIYGPCEPHFDVMVLDVFRQKVEWGDLTKAFRAMHVKWQPFLHIIEKRSSGIPLFQAFAQMGINVEGVLTVENKRNRVVNAVGTASVQSWFRQHRVLFPQEDTTHHVSWLQRLKSELKDFTGDGSSKDDQVDAITHLITHAIKLQGNQAMLPSDWTIERVDEFMGMKDVASDFRMGNHQPYYTAEDGLQILQWAANSDEGNDPFGIRCGLCHFYDKGFCTKHKRKFTSFDSCDEFQSIRQQQKG